MNATVFVVNGFHQGRRLRSQYFQSQAQAQTCAASMAELDCVVLATSTARSLTLLGEARQIVEAAEFA